jgi:hypothetical protein
MSRLRGLRNLAIILAIAAAVDFLPAGGRVAEVFSGLLLVLFVAGICLFASRFYREHRVDIHRLGFHRALLYGAIALGVVMVAAQPRMWDGGFTEFIWFVLVGLVVYSFLEVFRYWRSN